MAALLRALLMIVLIIINVITLGMSKSVEEPPTSSKFPNGTPDEISNEFPTLKHVERLRTKRNVIQPTLSTTIATPTPTHTRGTTTVHYKISDLETTFGDVKRPRTKRMVIQPAPAPSTTTTTTPRPQYLPPSTTPLIIDVLTRKYPLIINKK